jgi:membrane-bound lytic murein transglycosylase D
LGKRLLHKHPIILLCLSQSVLWLAGCQSVPPTTEPLPMPPIRLPMPQASPVLPSRDADIPLWRPPSPVLHAEEEEEDIILAEIPPVIPQPALPKQRLTYPVAREDRDSLWQRIRSGYALIENEHESIEDTMAKYLKHPQYFNRLAENAAPWLYHIVSQVEERGMPLEIALLPAVESGFQPQARSPKNAAGLWQFMPETGRSFGLKQDSLYDGRQDIVASTDAALTYLQSLHRQFDGDWLNALAAYNWGQGNVRKAIEKNIAAGKPTDYWSLDLPRETREFVPRLLAISEIIRNPKQYGVKLTPIADSPYFESVPLEQAIDLNVAADLIGLHTEDLKRLNPGYRGKITPTNGEGSHALVLPIGKADLFRRRVAVLDAEQLLPDGDNPPRKTLTVASVPSNNPPHSPAAPTQKTTAYRVKKGDTLARIAQVYQTDVATLKRLNRHLNTRQLKVGGRIRVPEASVQLASDSTKTPRTPSPKTTGNNNTTKTKTVHTVKKGETLSIIARRYQVTIAHLKRWNRLSGHRLQLGQQLLINP